MLTRSLPWLALATLLLAALLGLRGQAAYVDRIAPPWTPVAGALIALACAVDAPGGRGRSRLVSLAAAVLLLPSAIAGIFHLLRATGAIPLGVDWLALGVSGAATLTLLAIWVACPPLRTEAGLPLESPRWAVGLGVGGAAIYPVLKTLWLLGVDWLAPDGVPATVDAAYVVPVTLALLGSAATALALRWWDRPAPRRAHGAATVGGLALTGLGVSGLNATATTATGEGPVLGAVVYGSWLVWGVATLAVAARLSPHRAG